MRHFVFIDSDIADTIKPFESRSRTGAFLANKIIGKTLTRSTTMWVVYIIQCSDDSLYTGITTDLERRWRQHNSNRGAKFFRGRTPQQILYLETGHTRSTASQREAAIKQLSRSGKLTLIKSSGMLPMKFD